MFVFTGYETNLMGKGTVIQKEAGVRVWLRLEGTIGGQLS